VPRRADGCVAIGLMAAGDIDEVLAIERASFLTPWSRAAFRYELGENRVARCLTARLEDRVVGYLCMWEIGHEIHITNLAVHPSFRRRGIGRQLLAPLLEDGRRRGIALVLLEVRPTNTEAIGLYESLGFRVIGRRKGYYFDTGEDALVMEAALGGSPTGAKSTREVERS
jgi:ribosomal-protein-alanine N-acetyltransferase